MIPGVTINAKVSDVETLSSKAGKAYTKAKATVHVPGRTYTHMTVLSFGGEKLESGDQVLYGTLKAQGARDGSGRAFLTLILGDE